MTAEERTLVEAALYVAGRLQFMDRLADGAEADLIRDGVAVLERELLTRQREDNLQTLLAELAAISDRAVPAPESSGDSRATGAAGGQGCLTGRPDRPGVTP